MEEVSMATSTVQQEKFQGEDLQNHPELTGRKLVLWEKRNLEQRIKNGDLAALFPVFQHHKPLIIGTSFVFAERLAKAGVKSKSRVRAAFMYGHTSSVPYLQAIAAPGSWRHDLDGNPIEPVTEEHREHAKLELARLKLEKQQKKLIKKEVDPTRLAKSENESRSGKPDKTSSGNNQDDDKPKVNEVRQGKVWPVLTLKDRQVKI